MLVSHWAELRPEPCAWLSLDDSDSDLEVFLEYLVAAVRRSILDRSCASLCDAVCGCDRAERGGPGIDLEPARR